MARGDTWSSMLPRCFVQHADNYRTSAVVGAEIDTTACECEQYQIKSASHTQIKTLLEHRIDAWRSRFFLCVDAVKLLALFHRGRGLLLGALTRRAHVYVVGVNIVREKFRAAAAELKCSADDCYSFGTCCAHVRSFVVYTTICGMCAVCWFLSIIIATHASSSSVAPIGYAFPVIWHYYRWYGIKCVVTTIYLLFHFNGTLL